MNRIDQKNPSRVTTRRGFLGAGALGGAAFLAGGWSSLMQRAAAAPQIVVTPTRVAGRRDPVWIEATIPQLQSLMAKGRLTSRELTQIYLDRIAELNPLLHAVIETNPQAIGIAARLDGERRRGQVRGPLHGIPVLVKDNIATDDQMETTAGSLALVDSRVPADAPVVRRLRDAGAVILGKANLSEWANFRGFAPFNGWSARGGFTRDPYVLDLDPSGSSSGSAVAAAANLCAAAVGTETDGSIVSPSGESLIVGIKPTVGLVPQEGIIPIAHSQDTAGPMARSVTDAAILLAVLADVPAGYTASLRPGLLRGARIGVDRRYFTPEYGPSPAIVAQVEKALVVMADLGGVLVDTDSGNLPEDHFESELIVLLCEFKDQIGEYLAGLGSTSMRTLADLIRFNREHCLEEMRYYGQELFDMAEATGGLSDPRYLPAREKIMRLARTEGIDASLSRDRLDAIVAPSFSFASSPAAVAGYPNLAVPVGLSDEGKPAGIWMYGGQSQEQRLIGFAYDLEQALRPRLQPQYSGTVPGEPLDAGLCVTPSGKPLARLDRDPARQLNAGRGMRPCL